MTMRRSLRVSQAINQRHEHRLLTVTFNKAPRSTAVDHRLTAVIFPSVCTVIKKKRCSNCSTKKPLTEFHLNKRCSDGVTGQCKSCINAKQKQRKQELYRCHPELVELDKAKARETYYVRKAAGLIKPPTS